MNVGQSGRVLVVEDDEHIAHLMAAVLQLVSKEVVMERTLHRAFEAVRAQPFAIVLLDLALPDSHMIATIAAIPSLKRAGGVRVVVVTGAPIDDYMRQTLMEAGSDDIISKAEDNFTSHLRHSVNPFPKKDGRGELTT